MFDTKRTKGVENRDVHFCRLCGAEIAKLHFTNGNPYWTNVIHEYNRGRYIITGEGNNFNFKPQHNCVLMAERALKSFEPDYQEFIAKIAAAQTAIDALLTNDEALKNYPTDDQLRAVFSRLREKAESDLRTLNSQKAGYEERMNRLRTEFESLRQGNSIIPQDKPFIGRQVRVIKGRKVKPGTEGKVFWMGLDSFKDGIRIGIEAAGGIKHYTDASNVEVIQN